MEDHSLNCTDLNWPSTSTPSLFPPLHPFCSPVFRLSLGTCWSEDKGYLLAIRNVLSLVLPGFRVNLTFWVGPPLHPLVLNVKKSTAHFWSLRVSQARFTQCSLLLPPLDCWFTRSSKITLTSIVCCYFICNLFSHTPFFYSSFLPHFLLLFLLFFVTWDRDNRSWCKNSNLCLLCGVNHNSKIIDNFPML